MNKEFWRGKKVFITGHTGFKGGWLSLWLNDIGANVTGFALPPATKPSFFDICSVDSSAKSIIGDVRDYTGLKKCIQDESPDILFHMAAQALVLDSYKDPIETYETNLMGTVNILNSIRECPSVKALVNITSDKCYENIEKLSGYIEEDRMGGFDPYSSSKGCSELITAAYRASFFNPKEYLEHGVGIATARSGNVIGGGDWSKNRLIPDLYKAILSNTAITIRNPYATRPWQHVLEPLSGYLNLAEKLFVNGSDFSESWNFGPNFNDVQTVHDVATKFVTQWGSDTSINIESKISRPHEANLLTLDCSKAIERLKWSPQVNSEETIKMTCDWHKFFNKGETDMRSFSLDQIRYYESALIEK